MKKKLIKLSKLLLISILAFIIFNIGIYTYSLITPKIELNKSKSYYLYDNKEKLVFNNNDDWIPLDKIDKDLITATIQIEDKYFYKHIGFDYIRIGKAIITNLINHDKIEGASTITQQYARNLFLNFDKTWKRKIDEAKIACELEVHYTKDEILEGYLNTINYGGVYGIESAANYYFGKSASNLTLAESALLAGIPKSPSNYSPVKNFNKSKERQELILKILKKNKAISEKQYNDAINEKIKIIGKENKNNLTSINYFRDATLEELKKLKQIPETVISTGGLKIYTTLDTKAQEDLEKSVYAYINNNTKIETAAIMLDPNTGGVIALIGGNDYSKSEFNRALHSKRQVGSTMKPFLYYTALENGFTMSSSFTSEKTTFTFSEGKTYSPKNYNDAYADGPISMSAAVSYSDNVYAVKTHLFLGENMLVDTSKRVGITSNLSPIPSLALGTEEIGLLELAGAYCSLANLGNKVDTHFIKRVEDSKGNILYENKEKTIPVLNPSLTYILNEMLTSTYNKNFIDYNYPTLISLLPNITHKYALKSGTTDTDLWIMGYNKDVVLGVWNGFDNNQKIESKDYSYHKNIWIDTMEAYEKEKKDTWYDIPDNVVGTLVNPITGKLTNENDPKKQMFFYLRGTEPTQDNKKEDLDAVFSEKINN